MNEIRRVLSAAAWRLWMINALRAFIVTLSGAIVAVMLTLLAQRIFALSIEWPADWARIGAAGLAGAALGAIVWSFLFRARGLRVARELDERADLRESLSTALCFEHSKDPWAAEVVRTARERAVGVKVKQAIPITGPRFWPVPLALALALVIMVYTVPRMDVLGLFKKRQQVLQEEKQLQQVKAEIQKDQEEMKKLLEKAKIDFKDDEAGKEGAENQQPMSPEQMRRNALKKLTSMQEKIADQKSGEKAKQLEAMKQQLRQLKQPGPGPMDKLSQAMQKGDFKQAEKELDDLQKQLSNDSLSKEDKDKLQKQTEKLAEQLKQLAENKKDLEKKLEQSGMNKDQAKQAANKSPEDLKKALEEMKNLSEEEKKELMKMAQAQQQACKACQNMGEACSEMAKAMSKSGGMSQEAQEAMEKMAGQLSQGEMMQSDMDAMECAMKEACDKIGKIGEGCKGGNCKGDGEGKELKFSDCQSPWQAGDSAGKKGGGSGGPGQSGGGMGKEGDDTPMVTEKKMVGSKQTPGPIIGTRLVYGDQVKGEAQAEFSAAVESSSKAATEAIEGMTVPRELQNAVKGYFGRLDTKAKAGAKAAAEAPASKDHAEPAKK